MSPNATLIAGVGTLLLAMGIGVLIGRSGNHSTSTGSSPAVQVVKVPANGGATSATTAQAPSTKTSAKAKKAKGSGSSSSTQSTKSNPFLKTTKAAGKLPAPVVKVGSPGHGRGYKNGHFTGSFFGQ